MLRKILALTVVLVSAVEAQVPDDRMTIEFRSYNLVPGQREAFHRLVQETRPLLSKYEMDVVAHGPSGHDSTSYYLIRAFRSPEHRLEREESFYGSAEWRDGPRDRVLALIESFTTVVLQLDRATVDGLRLGRDSR